MYEFAYGLSIVMFGFYLNNNVKVMHISRVNVYYKSWIVFLCVCML